MSVHVLRSSYKDASSFIQESASRIQVLALEENVKDFGLTYFGRFRPEILKLLSHTSYVLVYYRYNTPFFLVCTYLSKECCVLVWLIRRNGWQSPRHRAHNRTGARVHPTRNHHRMWGLAYCHTRRIWSLGLRFVYFILCYFSVVSIVRKTTVP